MPFLSIKILVGKKWTKYFSEMSNELLLGSFLSTVLNILCQPEGVIVSIYATGKLICATWISFSTYLNIQFNYCSLILDHILHCLLTTWCQKIHVHAFQLHSTWIHDIMNFRWFSIAICYIVKCWNFCSTPCKFTWIQLDQYLQFNILQINSFENYHNRYSQQET